MRYYNIFLRIILLVFLITLFSSCNPSKKVEKQKTTIENNDTIYFLVFNISKDSTLEKSIINIVSKTKSLGKIKNGIQEYINSENILTIEVFEQNKLINTITINHPLFKNIEYINEKNELTSKYIELDKEEFFIRLQKTGDSNKIQISEKLKGKEKQELITIKL